MQVTEVSLPDLSDTGLAELLLTLYANRFLVVRTQGLTSAQLVSFAKRMGEPIRANAMPDYPEIIPINNIDSDTRVSRTGAAHWHTDQSFTKRRSSITMLYSLQAPQQGGETQYCDMAAAYAALPAQTQWDIEDLVVEHRHGLSIVARPGDHTPVPPKGWDQRDTVYHPLVRRHPVTGQKTLYAITGTSQGIKGMPFSEARELLLMLCEHAFQAQFLAEHKHRVDDLVMWDNPTTMHSASPIAAATGPQDTREIHRPSLTGEPTVQIPTQRAVSL